MFAWEGATEIMVDPSKVVINAAGTNMTVATYNEARFNIGDRRPEFKGFRTITFSEKDRAKMEEIFKQKQLEVKQQTKTRVHQIRTSKKVGREILQMALQEN